MIYLGVTQNYYNRRYDGAPHHLIERDTEPYRGQRTTAACGTPDLFAWQTTYDPVIYKTGICRRCLKSLDKVLANGQQTSA